MNTITITYTYLNNFHVLRFHIVQFGPPFSRLHFHVLNCQGPVTVAFRFLPARRYASAGNSDRNVSVCLSVCLSVTSRYCVKTKKASVVISSLPGSPKFSDAKCHPKILRGSPEWEPQTRGMRKFRDFLALSVKISKTVLDTAKVTISD